MRWSLSLLFFCLACQSQSPAHSLKSESQLAKVTREAPSVAKAEYGVQILASPRRHQELEAGIMGHPDVRKCVDQAATQTFESFDVVVQGRLAKSGSVAETKLERASKGFELCMNPALKAVNLGNGRSGLFKVRLYRRVGQNQIKKFE